MCGEGVAHGRGINKTLSSQIGRVVKNFKQGG
jgi:hypothetical protein